MTPTQLEDLCRAQYNATNDTFFSQAEIFRHLYQAELELCQRAQTIRNIYTANTVAGTQEYAYPTTAMSIKRITYAGTKLSPITFREDDAITLSNATTTAQGTPAYYFLWDNSIFLRPVPSAAAQLKIFTYDRPTDVTAVSTLSTPDRYHHYLIDYVLWRMALKDSKDGLAREYRGAWDKSVQIVQQWERRLLRGDSFFGVQDNEQLAETVIGAI